MQLGACAFNGWSAGSDAKMLADLAKYRGIYLPGVVVSSSTLTISRLFKQTSSRGGCRLGAYLAASTQPAAVFAATANRGNFDLQAPAAGRVGLQLVLTGAVMVPLTSM